MVAPPAFLKRFPELKVVPQMPVENYIVFKQKNRFIVRFPCDLQDSANKSRVPLKGQFPFSVLEADDGLLSPIGRHQRLECGLAHSVAGRAGGHVCAYIHER